MPAQYRGPPGGVALLPQAGDLVSVPDEDGAGSKEVPAGCHPSGLSALIVMEGSN